MFKSAFSVKKSGDIILQAGDRSAECFYFRLGLLKELSSFFQTLPPPSSSDFHDGTPLIPLHEASSDGLLLFLLAIKSTTTSELLQYPEHLLEYGVQPVCDAAVIGRTYDTPIIYKLLVECIQQDWPRDYYLEYAIWAIGDVRSRLPVAAGNTIREDAGDITEIDEYITDLCRSYAPRHWLQLQDFHLRQLQAPARFRRILGNDTSMLLPYEYHNHTQVAKCSEADQDQAQRVWNLISEAGTMKEVEDLRENGYGLKCEVCRTEARQRCAGAFRWLDGFTGHFTVKAG